MAATQYNKYIWLVDTIRSAGRITKSEIDRRWLHANLNEYHESRIPERTFFRCLNEIELLFDIEIKCLRSPYGGQYYISDSDSNSQTKQWLLSQFAMSQALDTSRELQDQILYEPIPAGTESAKYLRSLPLHHSQKEIEPCVFEWFVAPTLDFIQQLRTYGSELEILQPQSFREQFKAELEKQLALYK